MIIELFGPPGSGKTTFAHELARHLHESGYSVKVMRSNPRRTVQSQFDRYGILYFIYRICSAFAHTTYAIATSPMAQAEIKISGDLVKIMPPSQMIWRIRLWQYIVKLSRRWNAARTSKDIIIFDQGFVQAIVSLAIFNGAADEALLSAALDLAPPADFVIRLLAPRDIVEMRLRKRMQHGSKAAQLLEVKIATNMESFKIFEDVNRAASKTRRVILPIEPLDHESTQRCIGLVEKIISNSLNGLDPDRSTEKASAANENDIETITDGNSQ